MSKAIKTKSSLLIISHLTLIELGEQALALEDAEALRHIGARLLSLPLKDYSRAGEYYAALALTRQGDRAQAARLLEGVAGSGSLHFSNRAVLALGVDRHRIGDYRAAEALYQEAGKGQDALTVLGCQSNLSVLESECGEHRAALKRLEATLPIARQLAQKHPAHWLNHLNSLAVESLATGQIRAAQGYLEPCLRSSLLCRFPQWQETFQEVFPDRNRIYLSSPAKISARISSNHLALMKKTLLFPNQQQREHDELSEFLAGKAIDHRITLALSASNIKSLEDKQRFEELFNIYNDVDSEQRVAILEFARTIKSEKENKTNEHEAF